MESYITARTILIGWLLVFCAVTPALALPPVPVEGDRELLKFLRDTQLSIRGRYARGRLTGTYLTRWNGKIAWQGEATIEWDGATWYATCKHEDRTEESFEERDQVRDRRIQEYELLVFPNSSVTWFPKDRVAVKVSGLAGVGSSGREIVDLLPSVGWNKSIPEMLDESGESALSQMVAQFVVQQEGDIVTVVRKMKLGIVTEFVFDLAKSGSLIEYEDKRDPDIPESHAERGKFDWVSDGIGGWRLKDYFTYNALGTPDRETGGGEVEFHISQFDPRPTFAPNRFMESSLKFPEGSKIKELHYGNGPGLPTRNVEYYIGDPPKEENDLPARLKEVAEQMKKESFAKPR